MEAMTARQRGTDGAEDSGGCLIWIGAPGGLSSSSRSLRPQRSASSLGKHHFTQARSHLLVHLLAGCPVHGFWSASPRENGRSSDGNNTGARRNYGEKRVDENVCFLFIISCN